MAFEFKLPDLTQLNNPKIERELAQVFQLLIDCVSYLYNHVESLDSQAKIVTKDENAKASNLIGVLAQKFIEPSNSGLQTVNTNSDINTSQSGNKIYASPNGSSGLPSFRSLVLGDIIFILPLTSLDTKILKTDDNLTKVIVAAPYTNDGYVTIKDNNGHNIKLMTTA